MNNFKFNISLKVLNHLGRGLYRNFITVIGEAISNSWDADAKNVWIYFSKNDNYFVIKDDGIGMNEYDFRNKFLKIGYSKRKGGGNETPEGRPYIGSKGIGKLALLSCAKTINIISQKQGSKYIGGIIDNSEIDKAIEEDLNSEEYSLRRVNISIFKKYRKYNEKGTIIYFEDFDNGAINSIKSLRSSIALYFRFSLIDKNFTIYFNDEEITLNDLQKLIGTTEFLWRIKGYNDPYVSEVRKNLDEEKKKTCKGIKEMLPQSNLNIKGFVASVEKPRGLNILGMGEKVGVDLFVNGRLRETNIVKLCPNFSTRIVASYLYGQIHYNDLDDGEDRFTTNREGIKLDDAKVQELLICVEQYLKTVSDDWDEFRKLDGFEKSNKGKRSKGLFDAVINDLVSSKMEGSKFDKWITEIRKESEFNYSAYAECFILENIIRKYIIENDIPIPKEIKNIIDDFREKEEATKRGGNIYINIRPNKPSMKGLDYLSMEDLVRILHKKNPDKYAGFLTNAKEYKPFRNAVAHTALLTLEAKTKLNTVYENIKEHIKYILK